MKKNPKLRPPTTEEALQFLEDLQNLHSEVDEPTQAISLRIPGNLLRSVKTKAKIEKKKYQSLIVEMIRKGLK